MPIFMSEKLVIINSTENMIEWSRLFFSILNGENRILRHFSEIFVIINRGFSYFEILVIIHLSDTCISDSLSMSYVKNEGNEIYTYIYACIQKGWRVRKIIAKRWDFSNNNRSNWTLFPFSSEILVINREKSVFVGVLLLRISH